MAIKNSNLNMLVKNKKAIFKFGCAVHDEIIEASNLVIDETVNTVTKSQKIAGKIIKNGEPIVAKQVEMTIDTIAEVKKLAVKGGKRALKLIGMTKEFNSFTKTISKKVDAMPTAEDLIDNAKDYVANAKSDVEKTITKATDSIMKVAATAEKTIEAKTAEVTKNIKTTATKKSPAKKPTTAKKAIAKTVKPVAKKTVKAVAKKTAVKKVVKTVAKKDIAKVTKVVANVAPKKVVKAESKTDLTNIKGIGPSLADIMTANGIKNIAQLKVATPAALKIVATKAGNRYASFDTSLWVEAAKTAK